EAMEAKRLPPVRTARKPLEVRATYAIKSVRTNFPVNRETNVLIGLYRITPSGMKMTSSGRGSAANVKAARKALPPSSFLSESNLVLLPEKARPAPYQRV